MEIFLNWMGDNFGSAAILFSLLGGSFAVVTMLSVGSARYGEWRAKLEQVRGSVDALNSDDGWLRKTLEALRHDVHDIDKRTGVIESVLVNLAERTGIIETTLVNLGERTVAMETTLVNFGVQTGAMETTLVNLGARTGAMETTLVNFGARTGAMETALVNLVASGKIAKDASPLRLTDNGKKVAAMINADSLFAKYYGDLKKEVEESNPRNRYDIHQASMNAARRLEERLSDDEINAVKNAAYDEGVLLREILLIFAIMLRDKMLAEHEQTKDGAPH